MFGEALMVAEVKERINVIFTFSKEDVEALLIASGKHIKNGYVKENDDKQAVCSCCGKKIKVEDVGRFMPGSLKIICDDTICINEYILGRIK